MPGLALDASNLVLSERAKAARRGQVREKSVNCWSFFEPGREPGNPARRQRHFEAMPPWPGQSKEIRLHARKETLEGSSRGQNVNISIKADDFTWCLWRRKSSEMLGWSMFAGKRNAGLRIV